MENNKSNQEADKAKIEELLKTGNRSATLQFFAIYQKGKDIRVLPALLNFKFMNMAEMNSIRLGEALVSAIKIPAEPKPWSDISDQADVIFLALQSRQDWGELLTKETSLLKVEKIRTEVEKMEESLHNFSWRADYLMGKFNPNKDIKEGIKEIQNKEIETASQERAESDGIAPGDAWKHEK